MAPVPQEGCVVVQQQNPSKIQSEVNSSTEMSSINENSVQEAVEHHIEVSGGKLERKGSVESVGSMEEEGIFADGEHSSTPNEQSEDDNGNDGSHRPERSSSVASETSSCGEEGGRDSGIEAEREPDMVVPDADLMQKVVDQVEWYFSDANVARDKFLLKHIRRNKEGYVSLKLVSSFKKVKQLTKDWRVVAYSLNRSSTKIQINDLGTKIRRTEALPEFDETPVTKSVVALGLPLEKPSVVNVSQLFGECGDIALVRVLKAGGTVPPEVKSVLAKNPEHGEKDAAWVEFETPEAATAAVKLSVEGGMKVIPVLPESQKKQETKQEKQPEKQQNKRKNSSQGGNQQSGQGNNRRKSSASNKNWQQPDGHPNGVRVRRKAVSLPQTVTPDLSMLSAQVEARQASRRPKSKSCHEFANSGGSSPPHQQHASWVQRHLMAAAAASAASAAAPIVGSKPPSVRRREGSQGSLPCPETVVRFPKGPDGTKGFGGRRRSSAVSPTIAETVPAAVVPAAPAVSSS